MMISSISTSNRLPILSHEEKEMKIPFPRLNSDALLSNEWSI